MNILIVANHYAVCSARYATSAFERLGHTVKHVGPAMGRDIWGLTLPAEYKWEPKPRDFGEKPNLVIMMDSDPRLLDDFKVKLDHQGAKLILTGDGIPKDYPAVVWGVDNHARDYRRDWFDHYFLAHRQVSVMNWELKAVSPGPTSEYPDTIWSYQNTDMTHLPCCYDPTLHTPSLIPFEERKYDVGMIGVMYPQRWTLVEALREAGFDVLAGCGLVYENYVAAYHHSRIALNVSVGGDVAQRVFETAAMGCVVMTDDCSDFSILKPDGFWLLDDLESETVIQACKDILHEPEHAQVMVGQSQRWVEGHTWDERAKRIVEWTEQNK